VAVILWTILSRQSTCFSFVCVCTWCEDVWAIQTIVSNEKILTFSLQFLWSFNSSRTFTPEFLIRSRFFLTSEFSLFDWCADGFSTLAVCQWATPETVWKGCLKHGSYKLWNSSQLVWMQCGEQLISASLHSPRFIKVGLISRC